MSRKPFKLVKKVSANLESAKPTLLSQLDEIIKCDSFVLVEAYSESFSSIFSSEGKIGYIVKLSDVGEESPLSQSEKTITLPVDPVSILK